MSRIALVMTVVIAPFATVTVAQDKSAELKLGALFKGEVGKTKTSHPSYIPGTAPYYAAHMPVRLKAGQAASISCTVTGQGREVIVALVDPTGEKLGVTRWETKSATLKVNEVNVDGQYTIQVFSTLTGPFTLRATVSPEDVQTIEAEIESLKKQLADAEARLKRAKERK